MDHLMPKAVPAMTFSGVSRGRGGDDFHADNRSQQKQYECDIAAI
jgi:hypothetical protein